MSPPSTCRPHDPVTIQHLECIRKCLDFEDLFDVTIYALACLAFWSQARLGELLFENQFDWLLHITRGNVAFGVTSNACKYAKCWLPCTKRKPAGDWLLFTDSECMNSAYTALVFHLFTNSHLAETAPFFAFETLDGGWSPMWRGWFLGQCNYVWCSQFLTPINGHSSVLVAWHIYYFSASTHSSL